MQIIDSDGYRHNVGMILCNHENKLFLGRRVGGQDAWQFPQGGLQPDESFEDGLFRELREETGLLPDHVSIKGRTRDWLKYDLPRNYIRREQLPLCVGQKQMWFLLQFNGSDDDVCLDHTHTPEFDHWQWVDFWYPVKRVINFKQEVYQRALEELGPLVFPEGLPPLTD